MFKNSVLLIGVIALCLDYTNAEFCISCSSEKDPNCAQDPSKILAEDCKSPDPGTQCYMRVVGGHVLRGCSSDLDADVWKTCLNDSRNCGTCKSIDNAGKAACNDEIFPQHRLSCHICSGDLNSNCSKTMDSNPTPCPIYKLEDQCYIRKTAKGVERGCMSSSGTKCSNVSHCSICDGNGCNNAPSNSTNIPVAPSSATMWKTSMIFVSILVALGIKISL